MGKEGFVLKEIRENERDYLEAMEYIFILLCRLFQKLFIIPLLNNYLPRLSRKDKDTITFLQSLAPIIDLHKKIYEAMCDSSTEEDESEASSIERLNRVINALLDNMPMFSVYQSYIKNYNHAKGVLMSLGENELKSFFTEVHSSSECSKFTFENLISRPAQKVPRYGLLLEELKKKLDDTEENKPIVEKIDKVLDFVKEISGKLNKSAGDLYECSDLADIYERLGNDPRLKRKAIRQYIEMDEFIKVSHHSTVEKINLILFNDLLLLATNAPDKENPKKLQYQNSFDLKYISIKDVIPVRSEVTDEDRSQFSIYTPTYCIVLQAKSVKAKNHWMKLIRSTIRERLSNLTEMKDKVHLIMNDQCCNPNCPNVSKELPQEKRKICHLCCSNVCSDCVKDFIYDENNMNNTLPICPICDELKQEDNNYKSEVLIDTEPLPSIWKKMTNKDGVNYYINTITQEKSLLHPKAAFYLDKLYCTEIIPPGWRRCYTEDGDKYYLDTVHNRTQWDFPKESCRTENTSNSK